MAYLDLDLDVSAAGAVKRFLVKPMLTARLLQAAEIKPTDHVLVVGCASGYAAALAAKLAAHVTATESEPAVEGDAKQLAAKLGLANVAVKLAAAALGDPTDERYDVILLNGATEVSLDGLCQQLKNGGRLVGVFATSKPARAMIMTRSHDDLGARILFDAAAPILPGLERVAEFTF
jgi:protein-L-isoaspartate(D-aspartate) O-methyltransferase